MSRANSCHIAGAWTTLACAKRTAYRDFDQRPHL